jgi:hypothetical protein
METPLKDRWYTKSNFLFWEYVLPSTYGDDPKNWPSYEENCKSRESFCAGYRYAVTGLADELIAKAEWYEEGGVYRRVDKND